jgi:hypothetical protein
MSNEESKLKLWYAIATPHEDRTGRTRTSSAPFFTLPQLGDTRIR